VKVYNRNDLHRCYRSYCLYRKAEADRSLLTLTTMAKLSKEQLLADQARLAAHWAKCAKRVDHQAEARRLNREDRLIDRGLINWG
jgi:hypothetical protein